MAFSSALLKLVVLAVGVSALPSGLGASAVPERRAITELTAPQVSAFAPFTQFARAAYCPPSKLANWTCGEACSAVPDFKPALTGGNGSEVQSPTYYVGYWPDEKAVVVAHQGTNPAELLINLSGFNKIPTEGLNSTLFPGVPSNATVYSEFADEHASTAPAILAEVTSLIKTNNASTVISVGHSFGGAVAELDALFFKLNLPNVTVASYTYGTPRVGNAVYATYFDSVVSNFTRVNNLLDPVPIVPPRSQGFQHPSGEVHLLLNSTVACSLPDDDTDPECTDLSVPTIFEGELLNHLGPYDGIFIGTVFCT